MDVYCNFWRLYFTSWGLDYITGTPQFKMIIPVNSITVVLSWSEVYCLTGSGAITHYLVQYHSSCCGGSVQNVTTDGPYSTSCFRPDTKYCVHIPSGCSWSQSEDWSIQHSCEHRSRGSYLACESASFCIFVVILTRDYQWER